MSGSQEIGTTFLTSQDLEKLITSGNLSFENVDQLSNMDPNIALQLIQMQQGTGANPNLNTAAPNRQMQPTSVPRQVLRQQVQSPEPRVEISEQPKARGLRFRYECEGRSAGSIPGETSTAEHKTFPTIKIHNYNGHAVIVVSCVTKDEPYKPHPHNLVGKDCKKGVCTLRIKDTTVISFPHLGIQCAKKKDVEGNLNQRKEINVDPFQTGFTHRGQNTDLNVVRLCFQVFLPDEHGKITRIVRPVVSQPIHDKKALNELIICRVDKTSGKAKGGDEVFLLCEKINRDDVKVRFYEESEDGKLVWEQYGDFGQNDVHRQFAIVFRTPSYKEPLASQPVVVQMQLWRPSDQEGSEPIQFTYMPEDPDPDRIIEKRKRKAQGIFTPENQAGGTVSAETIKQRLKLKATRTATGLKVKQEQEVKQEVPSPTMANYSFNNTGSQKVPGDFSAAMATNSAMVDTSSSSQMFSQAGMSGGTMQYSNNTVPQQPAAVNVNQQLLQVLLSALQNNNFNQTQANGGNPAPAPAPSNQSLPLNSQEIVRQLLGLADSSMPRGGGGSGVNIQDMQDANYQGLSGVQNQEMSSIGSIDPNLLQNYIGDSSPMVSLEGLNFSELSGNFEFEQSDQNVAAFENVSTADPNLNQQQMDETTAAINALSRN